MNRTVCRLPEAVLLTHGLRAGGQAQMARNQGLDGEAPEQIAGRYWPDTCPLLEQSLTKGSGDKRCSR